MIIENLIEEKNHEQILTLIIDDLIEDYLMIKFFIEQFFLKYLNNFYLFEHISDIY